MRINLNYQEDILVRNVNICKKLTLCNKFVPFKIIIKFCNTHISLTYISSIRQKYVNDSVSRLQNCTTVSPRTK